MVKLYGTNAVSHLDSTDAMEQGGPITPDSAPPRMRRLYSRATGFVSASRAASLRIVAGGMQATVVADAGVISDMLWA